MREVDIQIVSPKRGITFHRIVQIGNEAQSEMVITRELLQLVRDRHVLSGDHINIIPEIGFDDV